ncbi:MAG TPA: heme o synthase [Caulobacterales bacterium]|nr:heme o synthase [Caulobacterales bacterium]
MEKQVTDLAVASPSTRAATAGDYFALMKPRVMSLVIFTGLAGMLCAPSRVDGVIGFAILLAIAAGAGGSGALNMWYDSDIDAKMKRTASRPVAAGRIPREEALALGLTMSILSVLLMVLAAGLVAAALLAFTIWFYAVFYTMVLKRSTPENIVIGGLAGALPPAIAWAAVTGSLSIQPLLLVLIIFLWTPPHFWALALYQRADYAAAGVPMLPVTHGLRETRRRILAYSVALAPAALAPAFFGLGGILYVVIAAAGAIAFIALAFRVWRSRAGEEGGSGALYSVGRGDRTARDLFAFSILYLAALFAALIAEHGLGLYRPF